MPETRHLNALFQSSGLNPLSYVLGCESSDNIPVTRPSNVWYESAKGEKLNQSGGTFIVPDSNRYEVGREYQYALRNSMGLSYGARCPFYPDGLLNNSLNVPMYYNGLAADEFGPHPYVMWVQGSYNTVLHYFKADGTDLGPLWSNMIGTGGANAMAWLGGDLWLDGTFTGSCGPIIPRKTISSLTTSNRYYTWQCSNVYDTPIQVINPIIIEDLLEYLPVEPEGQYVYENNGDYDGSSDPVGFPDLPSTKAIDTGLIAIYDMTTAQLQNLSEFLWSNLFDLDTFKKMFNDPFEAIMNLGIMPVEFNHSGTSPIRIGNITSNVSAIRCLSQYKIIDFGTISLKEYWASFADYSPYTKISIFLPYVGFHDLNVDEIMNGSIQLKGYCDILTGTITYFLKSTNNSHMSTGAHSSVLYSWAGNMMAQIPLTGSNMSQVISSIISTVGTIAGGIGATVATGGMTAPIAVGMAGSAIGNVMSAKEHTQHGGGLSGNTGMFGIQQPYLIIHRPVEIYPDNYETTIGVPSPRTASLKNMVGFVKVKEVQLKIEQATETELNMIESLLKEGVIV